MTSPTSTEIEIAPDLEAVRVLGPWLEASLDDFGCRARFADQLGEIELALHELAVNIVVHALAGSTTPFTAALSWSSPVLTARFADSGTRFDDAARPEQPEEPRVHGYGLIIIEQIADDLEHAWVDDENRWTVTFKARV